MAIPVPHGSLVMQEFAKLAEIFEMTRNFKQVSMLLGVHEHPKLLALRDVAQQGSGWKWKQALTEVMYRRDLHSLFLSLSGAAYRHERLACCSREVRLHCLLPASVHT